MAIDIKSYNQILGNMVRKIIADTPVNDINTGSVLLSLLEAAAQVDFENNSSILNVLELLNIDAIKNSDLEARAADYGLSKITAQRATGTITIQDSTISKRSTGLYQVKPAPISGSTQIFVNDASQWSPTGLLYIGRGTQSFEGPIAYTSIVDNTTFFTINLGSALQKDHLISDFVVDAQGTTDRLINAGVTVQIPANNQNPLVEFITLRSVVIPAGEDTISGVDIVAALPGTRSNAGINTITTFGSPPFVGATVFNPIAITDGRDVESDADLRERIKAYANTLARGTAQAIIASVQGVSDQDDSKQVASAVIKEPPVIGEPSTLYIDDGSGFEPSFTGQSVDKLLNSATGNEEFLQLANFPLPRPQVINTVDGPFQLTDGMQLKVLVDGVEELVTFNSSQFINIAAARLSEVIIAINDQSTLFKATFTGNSKRILLFPVAYNAEIIQVAELSGSDNLLLFANTIFKFPTNIFSYIRLYQNNILLNEKEQFATLTTSVYSSWNINSPGNLILAVDGTPIQDQAFSLADFGGDPFSSLTLDNWVAAFNNKYAGITAVATSSGRMQISSNKKGVLSKLEVVGGTYSDQIFSGQSFISVGQNADFQLNRQTGNVRILTDILEGDSITAGTEDAKGSIISATTPTGNYNLSTDSSGRPAEMIMVADSQNVVPRTGVNISIGTTLTITDQGSGTMRIMSDSLSSFSAAQPNDYIYITNRTAWINVANTGLYKISAKGEHLTANTDSYIEVKNLNIVAGTHIVQSSEDIQVFKADTYPQLWKGSFTPVPASATIQQTVDSINKNLVNVKGSIFKTNSVNITSSTENDGSIAIPVSVGRASLIIDSLQGNETGNPSHIANRSNSGDLTSFFSLTPPTNTAAEGTPGKPVWLNRYQYSDISGVLGASAVPGVDGVDTYSEELQSTGVLTSSNVKYDDVVSFVKGNNKHHYRSIRDKIAGDKIGTQHELPRTLMDHIAGETFGIMRSTGISAEDSVVFIVDQNSVAKTIDIPLSRIAKVNTAFSATDVSFSADDIDNEAGITFDNPQVWGKTINNTEFKNYAVWMRARNWYVSGGAGSTGGSFVIRAKEYGPHGENLRFKIDYPALNNTTNSISHVNKPDFTDITYKFGSGNSKSIALTAGDQFTVSSLGADTYRYTFTTSAVSLATVVAGDIISLLSDCGVSAANRGQFRIKALNIPGKTIDIYNPNGAITVVGAPEVTSITTVNDVVGTSTISSVTTGVVTGATITDNSYFLINDSAGIVAVVYDSNSAVGTPASYGANRILLVPYTVVDSNATLTALTSGVIGADTKFSATSLGNVITITNNEVGANAVAVDGGTATTFSFGGTLGTNPSTLDGKYFILKDANGSVAFWYNISGITSEPLHGANRSTQISTVIAGDSANTVATKTAVVIAADPSFTNTVLSNVITVTDTANGERTAASNGTSGFTLAQVTNGIDTNFETVLIATSVKVFPLVNTSLVDITNMISTSTLVDAAIISGTNPIVKATKDEEYVPAGPTDWSASLAYNHNPDPLSDEYGYVSFYDGINWVKDFQNTAPNFTLKTAMTLQDEAPLAYSVVSAPNYNSVVLGEYFKLVPTTLNNVYHHLTQKALSQLPIVANIDISNDIRRIQIKSKLLGSSGAIEVVGGNGNGVTLSVFGEAQIIPGIDDNYLEVKTAAFPVTLTKNTLVKITNTLPARRYSRLSSTDTIDVVKGINSLAEYRFNPKTINMSPYVRFTISDVSASYGRSANTVWRWLHNDGGSSFDITASANGAPLVQPTDEIAAGVTNAANLQTVILDPGTASTALHFQLTLSGVPTQGDYFTFESPGGVKFAVWFSVNGDLTAPTGATYVAAAHQIMISILSTNTEDEVISILSTILSADVNFLLYFSGTQTDGASFSDVKAGDLLNAYGNLSSAWSSGNKSKSNGDSRISGHPIINVDASARYVDVANPHGVTMGSTAIGSGTVQINPTHSIEWRLRHSAKANIVQISLAAPLGTATCTTSLPHNIKEGDVVTISDSGLAQTATVLTVTSPTVFTFTDTTALAAGTYLSGNVIVASKTPTKYVVESMGFNNLFKIKWVSGDQPYFVDCGVAVDDFITISGTSFNAQNNGIFRVLGVNNTSIIFQHSESVEELNTLVPFNNLQNKVTWTANSDLVTGSVGYFKNIVLGDWVKKEEDGEEKYLQVIATLDNLNSPTTAALATKIQIGGGYSGTSSVSLGVSFDQNSNVGAGIILQEVSDIKVHEGDSARITDDLFIDNISDADWFNNLNSGTFSITETGTDGSYRPFLRIRNDAAQNQTNRKISVSVPGFFIRENEDFKYESMRLVHHTVIDSLNENRRSTYLFPPTDSDKVSQSNGSQLSVLGKLAFPVGVTTGIDGYTYYTGLMRKVQRIVDGFEPDILSFPGRRAVGGAIETLFPLIKRIIMSVDVTTKDGVNLNEISNDIKSAIIRYIDNLKTGEDVILSEIIVIIMGITGVATANFNTPPPSTKRIAVADSEKAFVEPEDISIS